MKQTIKGRRIIKMNRWIKGRLGIYKNEFVYEYSEILKEWVGYPVKWYEIKMRGA